MELEVLSNTAVQDKTDVDEPGGGARTVSTFAPSPPMSTYLVAFVAGFILEVPSPCAIDTPTFSQTISMSLWGTGNM